MSLWQRIKRFSRSFMILALSCLVLEQVWYSVVVPGYFLGVLVSPVFWGIFSVVCFYLLWRFDADFFKEDLECYLLHDETTFMSPNYSQEKYEALTGDTIMRNNINLA
ncbi:hypothetical protein NX722_09280 [Endozoicomonas gorgoniicola]|uniref:Uncharacterized protein n=1 Tax=Endozoicomonas gorgoniicola TaxID=1234144 RepID=A0ABT3MTX7_9GAMM|nr:hypothetical protein [Endozoicomonas gorgoniicola]MCW7552830.1 hypothetical protein [Endozoicomonas gorgoniicola]